MKFNQWLVVIPARLKSERLPKKPLLDLGGQPLLARVYANLKPLRHLGAQTIAAIDDPETAKLCQDYGIPHTMTDPALPSGTDRCNAAALSSPNARYVLNVQGDEPFVDPRDLTRLMAQTESAQAPMTTLIYKNSDMTQFDDPNVVKVVVSDDGHAIYFSRAAIPHDREAHRRGVPSAPFWQHLGVYAFSRDGLHAFCSLPSSKLEQIERLEQLRAVSAGWRIKVCEAASKSIGIDTPEDLERARARFHG